MRDNIKRAQLKSCSNTMKVEPENAVIYRAIMDVCEGTEISLFSNWFDDFEWFCAILHISEQISQFHSLNNESLKLYLTFQ